MMMGCWLKIKAETADELYCHRSPAAFQSCYEEVPGMFGMRRNLLFQFVACRSERSIFFNSPNSLVHFF